MRALPPPALHRRRIEYVLHSWRASERLLRCVGPAGRFSDEELAIHRALAELQRYTTMEQLVAGYVQRLRAVAGGGRHVLAGPGGRLPSRRIVEEVAFWRRLQQLIATR